MKGRHLVTGETALAPLGLFLAAGGASRSGTPAPLPPEKRVVDDVQDAVRPEGACRTVS